jgi:hypothetical protein
MISVDGSPCREWVKLALERSERISSASRKSLESFFGGSWDRVLHVPHGGRLSFLAHGVVLCVHGDHAVVLGWRLQHNLLEQISADVNQIRWVCSSKPFSKG